MKIKTISSVERFAYSKAHWWRLFCVVLFGGLLLITGCGGGNSNPVTPGSTQFKIGDAPADSVLALELTITNITLTNQSGGSVTVLSSADEIEASHLAGTVETLALSDVPSGTYTQASISYSGAEITYIPAGSTTPVEKQLSASGTANVPLNSLSIGTSSVVSFDLNAAQSLTFDAGGNVTALNPVFTASAAAVAAENAQEEESGAFEVVGAINAAPSNNAFVVSLQMMPQSAKVNVNSNTSYSDGLNTYNDLKQGMLVEVEATTQPDGSLLAKQVELVENEGIEAEGIITSVTNPLTQFTIVDEDGVGSGLSPANIGSNINVNVSAISTSFRADLHHVDMSGLSFSFSNAANVAKGQNVQVESSGGMQTNSTINADKVVLVKQALSGTVSNYVASGSSSATFTLSLPAESAFFKLTGVNAITVYQQPGTELKGLSAVNNGSAIRVRGMLFFDGAGYHFVAVRIALP
ncbi:MAG TPA: DUF5666 domain-containing protein [Terriglobales bacterium]|nr:DUF5666 domain-containing protein [Terriglobales bacterium]